MINQISAVAGLGMGAQGVIAKGQCAWWCGWRNGQVLRLLGGIEGIVWPYRMDAPAGKVARNRIQMAKYEEARISRE